MYCVIARCTIALSVAVMLLGLSLGNASAQDTVQIARGRYLVEGPAGCGDCHTPGGLSGKPDQTRHLGGSDVGLAVPGLGVFVPPNLTPDNETGLGNWTTEQIVTAFTKGTRPDGRMLSPAMPTQGFAHLSRLDALAVAAYLKSLKPVKNAVPDPFGPRQKIDVPVMILLPAAVYNRLLEER